MLGYYANNNIRVLLVQQLSWNCCGTEGYGPGKYYVGLVSAEGAVSQ